MTSLSPFKVCTYCKQSFPGTSEYFNESHKTSGKLSPRCKVCYAKAQNRYGGQFCKFCGKLFSRDREQTYCSGLCRAKDQYPPLADRFWERVQKTESCWLWTAAINPFGYGLLDSQISGLAHRFSYYLHYGPFDYSLRVCHKCDNPPCVNPDHLFLGTPADNTRDMVAKNRHRKGQDLPGSKLKDPDVIEIRRAYAAREATQRQLAERFGVKRELISKITLRKNWKHI